MSREESPPRVNILKDLYEYHIWNAAVFVPMIGDPPNEPSDPHRVYDINSTGFRGTEFKKDTELVFAGCSFTYGMGITEEAIWGNQVARKLGVSSSNVSIAGGSVSAIVESLFIYFKTYGNPKTLLCLFPDPYRVKFPADHDVITSKQNTIREVNAERYNPRKIIEVHTAGGGNPVFHGAKYIRRPFLADDVITQDFALYSSIRSIRYLEQYCKSAGIKLAWSTWSESWAKEIQTLAGSSLDFDYVFSLDSNGCYSYKKTGSFTEMVTSDFDVFNHCRYAHSDIECLCDRGCHDELLEKYGEDFFIGTDRPDDKEAAHPGVHRHAHFADAFLAQL